jgi:hypothetical protein
MAREIIVLVLLLLLAGYGIYYLASSPQVQELFSSRPVPPELLEPKTDQSPSIQREEPLDSRSDNGAAEKPPRPDRPAQKQVPTPREAQEPSGREPSDAPELSNDETGRVLLQILAARKLATGITLAVSDDSITVVGSVPSAEARSQILDVLNKGRGARRLLSDQLIIETVHNGSQ